MKARVISISVILMLAMFPSAVTAQDPGNEDIIETVLIYNMGYYCSSGAVARFYVDPGPYESEFTLSDGRQLSYGGYCNSYSCHIVHPETVAATYSYHTLIGNNPEYAYIGCN